MRAAHGVEADGSAKTTGNRIATVLERLLALGLIAAIIIDFINVIGRYTGSYTLLGADEIEIDVLVWITFLGAIAITWRGLHLRMDILSNASPPLVRKIIVAAETAVTLVVTAFVAYQSFIYVEKLYEMAAVSDILRIPLWIPHSAVSISFASMAVLAVVRIVAVIANRPKAPE